MSQRKLAQAIPAMETSDGAGVKLRRSLGSRPGLRLDPFLMLDEFGTDNPNDYIAGFPEHPHRGFETVTYMLDGHMQHRDHLGNVGDLGPGGVQWMTAGRGVIHSEVPQQDQGRMRGFQLWINLPATEKLKPANYRDIPPDDIPTALQPDGSAIKVIAGTAIINGTHTQGPINTTEQPLTTDPMFLDVTLPPGGTFTHPITLGHNSFVYVCSGNLRVGAAGRPIEQHAAGILSTDGDTITLTAGNQHTHFILLAGKPLQESIAQYGPFVMNTRSEIEQALHDYQAGTLTTPETVGS